MGKRKSPKSGILTAFNRFKGLKIKEITALAHTTNMNIVRQIMKSQATDITCKAYQRNANALLRMLVSPTKQEIKIINTNIYLNKFLKIKFDLHPTDFQKNYEQYEKLSKDKRLPVSYQRIYVITYPELTQAEQIIYKNTLILQQKGYQKFRITICFIDSGQTKHYISTPNSLIIHYKSAVSLLFAYVDEIMANSGNYSTIDFEEFVFIECKWW